MQWKFEISCNTFHLIAFLQCQLLSYGNGCQGCYYPEVYPVGLNLHLQDLCWNQESFLGQGTGYLQLAACQYEEIGWLMSPWVKIKDYNDWGIHGQQNKKRKVDGPTLHFPDKAKGKYEQQKQKNHPHQKFYSIVFYSHLLMHNNFNNHS